jgi:hypothetical protein
LGFEREADPLDVRAEHRGIEAVHRRRVAEGELALGGVVPGEEGLLDGSWPGEEPGQGDGLPERLAGLRARPPPGLMSFTRARGRTRWSGSSQEPWRYIA